MLNFTWLAFNVKGRQEAQSNASPQSLPTTVLHQFQTREMRGCALKNTARQALGSIAESWISAEEQKRNTVIKN